VIFGLVGASSCRLPPPRFKACTVGVGLP
jgi:hypothetical protein